MKINNKIKEFEKFRKELIKMHEEDNNKHALQWFLNDIFESAEKHLVNPFQKEIKEIQEDVDKEDDYLNEMINKISKGRFGELK